MNELIRVSLIQIGGCVGQTVNARDLYNFLEVGRDFSNWIKSRIEQYGFSDGQDYVTAENLSTPNLASANSRPQTIIDYHLSIDMAKELAMVERNHKGRQARQYFIECERRVKSAEPATSPGGLTRKQLLLLALQAEEERAALESQVVELNQKAEALDRLATANGGCCITDAAKALQVKPKQLFSFLEEKRWIYRRMGGAHWLAYQDKIDQGLLDHKLHTVDRGDGLGKVVQQVHIKPKGMARLSEIFNARSAL